MTKAKTQLKITLVKSLSGRLQSHIACVRGLGLRRLNHTVRIPNTLSHRGMIQKVHYLLKVEEETCA